MKNSIKKLISILLLISMLFAFSFDSYALTSTNSSNQKQQNENIEYDIAHDIDIYNQLKNYKNIDDNGNITVDTKGYGITNENSREVFNRVLGKHPDLFYVDTMTYTTSSTQFNKYIEFYNFHIKYEPYEIEVCTYRLNNALNEIYEYLGTQNISEADDIGKAMIIYNFICLNTWYHGATTWPTFDWSSAAFINAHNAYGILVNNLGVCDGYAKAFMLIANHYGLKTGYAQSKDLQHAWNVVKIKGEWYHLDTTWDDKNSNQNIVVEEDVNNSFFSRLNQNYLSELNKVSDSLSTVYRDYFLLTESELLKKSPERADMFISVPDGEAYTPSQTPITSFLKDLRNNTFYYNSKWYYVDSKYYYAYAGRKDTNIVCCNSDGSDMQTVIPMQFTCKYFDIKSFDYNYESKSFGLNGNLYYCTPTEIRKYNLSTGEDTLYYAPTLEKGFVISDIAYIMGNLVMEERTRNYIQSQNPDVINIKVLCGDGIDIAKHTYDGESDTECNYCGKKREVTHAFDSGCGTTCLVCGYTRTVEGKAHIFDDNCDSSCNICGHLRKVTHDVTEYEKDVWLHQKICSNCHKKLSIQQRHGYSDHFDTTCDVCGYVRMVQHEYNNVCDTDCNVCGYKRTAPHTFDNECDEDCNLCGFIRTVKHIKRTDRNIASTYANGEVWVSCDYCGKLLSHRTVPKIGKISVSKTKFIYNGKMQKPTVKITDSKGKVLKLNTDYTLSYSTGCKSIGKYTLKIKFKGDYGGTVSKTFTIVPKTASISSLVSASKGFTVKWKKQSTQTTGYQIQIATNSRFTSGVKSYTITKNSTLSKKITKLTAKKKYYVRIRTYKTVKGTKYYSSWSSAKSVTTKK